MTSIEANQEEPTMAEEYSFSSTQRDLDDRYPKRSKKYTMRKRKMETAARLTNS